MPASPPAPLRIIPVLDLMQGQVVRGIAGRRDEYKPLKSPLCGDAQPLTVARAFQQRFDLSTLYVADLDAIAGAAPSFDTYTQLLQAGLELWVDAGIGSLERVREMTNFDVGGKRLSRVIVGLESLSSPDSLAPLVNQIGPQQMIFSLDLNSGRPLTCSHAWSGLSALDIAGKACAAGVREILVLDLARVGLGQGVGTEGLCRQIKARHPHVAIMGGGGVRAKADLQSLASAGCCAALVASALHDGWQND